ncbi:MAG: hypothetical protein JXA58_06810 [Dehalococcoidia bacterium]|nr:hypothetical protein [Dehalococcoidia bacterium]
MSVDKNLRDFQRQEQRRLSDLETTGAVRSKNCFGRHLNVSMGIGMAVYFYLAMGALAGPFMYWFGASPAFWAMLNCVPATIVLSVVPTGELGHTIPHMSNMWFLGIPVLFPMWWALGQKRRSRAWLFALLVPFGWIAPFVLKDQPSS